MSHLPAAFRRSRFREARFNTFVRPIIEALVAEKGSCRVLDMGGDPDYWKFDIGKLDVEITILNIEDKQQASDGRFVFMQGDARDVRHLPDDSFDFVHSNSLIEHVGRWEDVKRAAREIRRLAPAYYVQTPNFWFPIDPHSNMPLLHWLPQPLQRRIVSARANGFYAKARDLDHAMAIVEGTTMLDRQQLAQLFPDAEITTENLLFMAKSLIAIRRPLPQEARVAAASPALAMA